MCGKPILLLRLEAPLQSYGERSKWDFRDSAFFPTKSGIIGMIACGMGLKRDSEEIAGLSSALTVHVRADMPGRMSIDYNTVTGIIHTADGKTRGNKGEESTIISSRQYLEDASFLVAVCGEEKLLLRCRDALLDPVWPYYLGRRCCVPTRPVFEALTYEYGSPKEAFEAWPRADRSDKVIIQCQYEDENGNMLRRDDVVGNRAFAYRGVLQQTVKTEVSP